MKFREYLLNEKFYKANKLTQGWGGKKAYCQIEINPVYSEVLSLIEDFKESNPVEFEKADKLEFIRGFFDNKQNLYVWYGTFFHEPVAEEFNIKNSPEYFRFSWEKNNKFLSVEFSGNEDIDYEAYFEFPKELPSYKKKELERLKLAFPIVFDKDKIRIETDDEF